MPYGAVTTEKNGNEIRTVARVRFAGQLENHILQS
jgi:hypothetical protein